MTLAELKKECMRKFNTVYSLSVMNSDGDFLEESEYNENVNVLKYIMDFQRVCCKAYIDDTPELEKSIDLNFTFKNGILKAVITEPESCVFKTMNESVTPLDSDTLQDFACDIGMEIYSWLSIWAEEYNTDY